jgi:hypothetical protein
MGKGIIRPYSFEIDGLRCLWSFCFEAPCQLDDGRYIDVIDLSHEQLLSMYNQLTAQFKSFDWREIGKIQLYRFSTPSKEFEWCYSAKTFRKFLNQLCAGSVIQKIYVGATNYAEPLRVDQNYVNYYIGSELLIQFDSFLLDLLIHAEGLFQWRVFKNGEHTIPEPVAKYIEDGYKEFCDIGNVYDNFNLDYTNSIIKQVTVDDTDCWPWNAKGFDESKLGSPVELPEAIHLHLDNGCILSLRGLMDDFAIKMAQL